MDALVILVLFLLPIGSAFWARQTELAWVLVATLIAFVLGEVASYVFGKRREDGKRQTISQRFGAALRDPKTRWKAIAVLASLEVFVQGLVWHFWAMR